LNLVRDEIVNIEPTIRKQLNSLGYVDVPEVRCGTDKGSFS
jgi:hypothetical protein